MTKSDIMKELILAFSLAIKQTEEETNEGINRREAEMLCNRGETDFLLTKHYILIDMNQSKN